MQHPRPPRQQRPPRTAATARATSPGTTRISCWPTDSWFRGLELKYGPDGGVYLTDWSDIGECHENDADNAHRENGRIFKITYGDVKPVKVDLARQSDDELARLQVHANDWYVRTARRLLQEPGRRGQGPRARRIAVLREILATDRDVAAPAPRHLGAARDRRAR